MTETQPVLRTRRSLPSGRAVLGALLITLAAIGVLFATRLNDEAAFQNVVVAANDLAPGTLIEADDVASVRLKLDSQATWVINDVEDVIGNVTVGPVEQLEFLQRSNVVQGRPGENMSGLAEVSIQIEPTQAPGSIAPGEIISVLATFDDVEPPVTRLVADRIVVLSFDDGNDGLSTEAGVLRLGVADGQLASDIVLASQTGEISIIGVTGAPGISLPEITTR